EGKIVAGGGGTWLRRFLADGTEDSGFVSGIPSIVSTNSILPLDDGKVLVAGDFAQGVVRLLSDGSLDGAFTAPTFNNDVFGIALQADGKLLVTGQFSTVGGATRQGLARLNANGSYDTSYAPSPFSTTYAIALLPDGKLMTGGYGGLRRLNADGSHDTSFAVTVAASSASARVYSLAVQSDGSILFGGDFLAVNGVARANVARVFADGTLDPDFDPGADAPVKSVMLREDGGILLGGKFTEVGGVPRSGLALLPNNVAATNSAALTSATQLDWQLSGSAPELTRVRVETWDGGTGTWVLQGNAARVAGGWQATGLSLPASAWIRAIGRSSSGRYNGSSGLIEKRFTYGGTAFPELTVEDSSGTELESSVGEYDFGAVSWPNPSAPMVFTLRNTGTADLSGFSFQHIPPSYNGDVEEFEITPPAVSTLAPGESTTFEVRFLPGSEGLRRMKIVMTHNDVGNTPFLFEFAATSDYRTPATLELDVPRDVRSAFEMPDGKLLVAGAYDFLCKINPDGTRDETFNPAVASTVFAFAVQPDGKILIAGAFSSIAGTTQRFLARLYPDGSLDTSFTPDISSWVLCIVLQPDGRIVIGGDFSAVDGVARNRIARLETDGSLDPGFDPDASGPVWTILPRGDGGFFVGGTFTQIGGVTRGRLAKLTAAGAVDGAFADPLLPDDVRCLALHPDGSLLAGGRDVNGASQGVPLLAKFNMAGVRDATFVPFTGTGSQTVYSIAVQADGRILAGGEFSSSSIGAGGPAQLARFEADGAVDKTFDPNPNLTVYCLALQDDGRLLVGGRFTQLGGITGDYLNYLPNDIAASRTLSVGGGAIQWALGGSQPALAGVTLESWNGSSWTTHAATVYVGGWESTGLSLPANGWVRARGFVGFGQNNGSMRVIEEVLSFGATAVEDLTLEAPAGTPLASGDLLDTGSADWSVAGTPIPVLLRN
ncbi:MAG: hypothetical protein ACC661_06695, partial [Verrucomicrobiales bacterium]